MTPEILSHTLDPAGAVASEMPTYHRYSLVAPQQGCRNGFQKPRFLGF